MQLHTITAGVLEVAYLDEGTRAGPSVVLLHGFPYDVHACRAAGERLVGAGCRVITPYLRGFGPTRFLDPRTPRSGQQGALAFDLLALLDALAIPSAVLAGYDWGGRAACILAALHPERVRGLVTGNGYNLQNIAAAVHPQSPENELRLWYQYYLHGARGAAGLAQNRRAFCKLLWQLWSPHWQFDDATFERSAAAFDNPDFVDVVVHSYRHRFSLVAGDPAFDDWERALAAQPRIGVPAIAIDGAGDGVMALGGSAQHQNHFTGPYQHRVLPLVGHNLPQEAPYEFAAAVLELL
jgi:pimeloyl-ACP methyl ester carboxylesterase